MVDCFKLFRLWKHCNSMKRKSIPTARSQKFSLVWKWGKSFPGPWVKHHLFVLLQVRWGCLMVGFIKLQLTGQHG